MPELEKSLRWLLIKKKLKKNIYGVMPTNSYANKFFHLNSKKCLDFKISRIYNLFLQFLIQNCRFQFYGLSDWNGNVSKR